MEWRADAPISLRARLIIKVLAGGERSLLNLWNTQFDITTTCGRPSWWSEMFYLENMKRTVPLATSPTSPITDTMRPMMRNALGGKCFITINCSLVQNGSSSSADKESLLRSMRPSPLLAHLSSSTPSSPLLKFIWWTMCSGARRWATWRNCKDLEMEREINFLSHWKDSSR